MKTSRNYPSLKINSAWTFAGTITYGFCQWSLMSVLANYRGPEIVGRYALAMAIVIPIFSFFNMHLRAVQATDSKENYTFQDYFGLRIFTTCAGLVVVALIGIIIAATSLFIHAMGYQPDNGIFCFSTVIIKFSNSVNMFWIILAAGVMKAAEALNDLTYGSMQQDERMNWISISMIARGLFWIIGASAVIIFGGSLIQAILVIAAGNLILFFVYDLPKVFYIRVKSPGKNWQNILPSFHSQTMRKLFVLSFPLALIYMLVLFNSNMPRYFLAWSHGEAAVGIFAALFYLTMPLSLALESIGQAASPRFAKYYANGKISAFRKLILKIGGVGLVLGILATLVVYFFHKPIVSLYGEEFVPYSPLLFLIFLVSIPGNFSTGFGYAITATRRWREMLGGYIIITVLYAGSCAVLIPAFELNGAAAALTSRTLISMTILTIMLREAVRVAKNKGVNP